MIFKVLSADIKSPDWKILSVKEGIEDGKTYVNVSINRNDKTGTVAFPAFDQIIEGFTFEADPWANPAGKMYLFGPKPKTAAPSGGGMRGVAAAQERKAVAIEKTMDRKEAGILVAAAMRDCTLITLASIKDQPFPDHSDFVAQFKVIKNWYLKEWNDTEKAIDLPF